jgi:uncharacterized repeat protein (TIGR03803 family)
MKKLFLLPALLAAFGLIPVGSVTAQNFATLHFFGGNAINNDGAFPQAGLVSSGGAVYGTTYYGGNSGYGSVFAFNADGTGFKSIHSFAGGNEGANPQCNLLLSGNTFYGTTVNGGAGSGTVFKMNTDGTGFAILHTFSVQGPNYTLHAYTNSDGAYPAAGLVLSGNTLYGMAEYGGPNVYGTLFAVNTDGTDFTNLHFFASSSNDGSEPQGGLVLSGNTLYGTTEYGGTNNDGTVFAIGTNGKGYTNLFQFTTLRYDPIVGGYTNVNGANPVAGLVLSGNILYGTSSQGGPNTGGTVFAISTNGTGITNLYNFTYGNDGGTPKAGLFLSGNTLYGTTSQAGTNGYGTVFAVGTNGTGFTNLYSFTDGNDGNDPVAGLVLSGNTLYGTTPNGGTNGYGNIFGVFTNGSAFTNVHIFSSYSTNIDGTTPLAGLALSGNTMYGTTEYGGNSANGTVFAINTDGTGYTNLYSFSVGGYNASAGVNTNSDGASPEAGLILSGNTLYGTAYFGGAQNAGTVFKVNTDGTSFTNLHSFSGFSGTDGGNPQAGLVLSGNILYGTTSQSATLGGTVFAIHTDGTGFTNVYSFSGFGNDGGMPEAGVVLSGNSLYGTVSFGSTNGAGAVFKVNTDSTGFNTLYAFSGGNDGSTPMAGLVLSGTNLYGTTEYGGTNGNGVVFAIHTDGTGFKNLHSFTALSGSASTNSDGADPVAGLILSGNTLYGTAKVGGIAGNGTVFAINTDGTGFTNYGFSILTDSAIPVAGLVLSASTLYGTSSGVPGPGNGTVFSLTLGSTAIPSPPAITSISLSGTNLVINGTNGQSGGTYETLTSTNLVLPLNQWMPVATNVLNANGNFTITATNAVNPADQQRFFRILQMQ